MDTFQFSRPTTVDQAVQLGATSSTAQQSAEVRFVAGGTTLIDLMKLNVERPKQVVDINVLPLDKIQAAVIQAESVGRSGKVLLAPSQPH